MSAGAPRPDLKSLSHLPPAQPGFDAPLPQLLSAMHRGRSATKGGSETGRGGAAEELTRGTASSRGHPSDGDVPGGRARLLGVDYGSRGGDGGDGGDNNSTVVAAAAASSGLSKLPQGVYERQIRGRDHTRKSRHKFKTELLSLQVDVCSLPGGADLFATAKARADAAKTETMRSWSNHPATTEEAVDGPLGETKGACETRLKHYISAIDKRLRGVRPDVRLFKVRLKRLQNQRSGFGSRKFNSALVRELNAALRRGLPPSLFSGAPPGSPSSGAIATTVSSATASCLASSSTARDAAMMGRDGYAVVDTHAALGGDDAHPPKSANARDSAAAVTKAVAHMVDQGMEVPGAGDSLADALPACASLCTSAVAVHPAEGVLGWMTPVPDGAVFLDGMSSPRRSVTPAVAPGTPDDQVQPFGVDTRADAMKELGSAIERLFNYRDVAASLDAASGEALADQTASAELPPVPSLGCSISPSRSKSALEQLHEAAGAGAAGVVSTDCDISPVSTTQCRADEHVMTDDDRGSDGGDSGSLPFWKATLGDPKAASPEEMVNTTAALLRRSPGHSFLSSLPSSPSRLSPLFSSSSIPAVSGHNEIPAGRTPGSSPDADPGQHVVSSFGTWWSPSRAATSLTTAMDLDDNGDGGSAGGITIIPHQEEEFPFGSPDDWTLVTDWPRDPSDTSPTRARVGWWTSQAADDVPDTGATVPAAQPVWPSDVSAYNTTPAG